MGAWFIESNTMNTEHKIAIVVRYIASTNTKGSRISLSLPYWKSKRKVLNWNHEWPANSAEQAEHWLMANGVTPDTLLDMGDFYVLACPWSERPAIFKAFGIAENEWLRICEG